MKIRAADKMLTVPWLITRESFDAMYAIAQGLELDSADIAKAFHGPKSLALRDGQRRDDSGRMTVRDGVAIIPIDGPIFRYADMFTDMSGGVTTAGLARDFQRALEDPLIGAILFVIDSPGGEAEGIAELADAIYSARGQKPIGAYAEGYTASAAYWLASAAEVIGADSTALLGSIGVLIEVSDPAKKLRPTIEFVSKQAPNKRPDPTKPSGQAILQKLTDELGDVFIAAVAHNREVSVETVLSDFGQGGLLVGQLAVDAGLADYLTSEEGMIRDLAARARGETMPATRPRAQEDRMKLSDMWAGFFNGAKAAGVPIEPEEPAKPAQPATAQTPAAQASAQPADPQVAQLRAELAQARALGIKAAADTWVTEQLGAGRMLPAERDQAHSLYTRAAELDAVTVQTAGTPTNVELVRKAYESRPAHKLAQQVLPGQAPAAQVLPAGGNAQEELLQAAEDYGRSFARQMNGPKK